MSAPHVSIVTPSLNQGRFIRQAIDSVLAQTYPHIDYLVVDGGSDDETLSILHSYGDQIRWLSEPDHGQAHAVNKGFGRMQGSLLAWLNADDAYEPHAVATAVDELGRHPRAGLIYGEGAILNEDGEEIGRFEGSEPPCLWRLVHYLDYILQPTTFFTRVAFETVGGLDESLHYGLDWDLWIRLAAETDLVYTRARLASSREYSATKTSRGGWPRLRELGTIVKRHAGRFWTPGVRLYAADTLRCSFARRGPRALARLANGFARRLTRFTENRLPVFADGWMTQRSVLLAPGRWPAARAHFEVHRVPATGPLEVTFAIDGATAVSIRRDSPGDFSVDIPLSASPPPPLVEIRVHCNFSFRFETDRRRLSIRCTGLEAGP